MDLFGRKKRQQVADLKARVQRLIEERDQYKTQATAAQAVTSRIAVKFRENHTLGWSEAGRLDEHIDGLMGRRARLVRACARYRAEITRLAIDLRWKTARVAALEAMLADRYAPGGDRAIAPAEPKPVDEQMARELADARRLLAVQAETIRQLQDTNEAHDRDLANRAGASVPTPGRSPAEAA